MRVLQFIGYISVALGMALVALAGGLVWVGRDLTQAAGQLWFELNSASLNTFQAVVQRYLHPDLWNNAIVPLLLRPAWEVLVFLIVLTVTIGVALIVFARARRRDRRRLMPRGS
jgi:hypothetical protein